MMSSELIAYAWFNILIICQLPPAGATSLYGSTTRPAVLPHSSVNQPSRVLPTVRSILYMSAFVIISLHLQAYLSGDCNFSALHLF